MLLAQLLAQLHHCYQCYWSTSPVRRWTISKACWTILMANSFLPLLRPCIIKELVSLSTIGHCIIKRQNQPIVIIQQPTVEANLSFSEPFLAYLPEVCGKNTAPTSIQSWRTSKQTSHSCLISFCSVTTLPRITLTCRLISLTWTSSGFQRPNTCTLMSFCQNLQISLEMLQKC